jgi:hypothetical protein
VPGSRAARTFSQEADRDDRSSGDRSETAIGHRHWRRSAGGKTVLTCGVRIFLTGIKRAAQTRLDNAAELMAKELLGIALTADSEGVKLAAIKDALDRTIGKAPTTVEIGPTKPYEEVLEGISTMSRAESRRARGVPDTQDNFAGVDHAHLHASSQEGAERQSSSPPGQQDPANPNQPAESLPRRESSDPTTDHRDIDRDRPQQPPRHLTGMDAIREANAANRQIGALKAIESPHRRYKRPG